MAIRLPGDVNASSAGCAYGTNHEHTTYSVVVRSTAQRGGGSFAQESPVTWTEARIAQLTYLWATGISASGIAAELGDVSRSAVLGKLHRLKLLGSRLSASAPRRYEGALIASQAGPATPPRDLPGPATPPAPLSPPRSPWREAAFDPLPGSAPRPWLTREFGECAFPVGGEEAAVLSCCAPARRRSAYCAAHHAIVFRPVPPAVRDSELRRWTEAAERCAA